MHRSSSLTSPPSLIHEISPISIRLQQSLLVLVQFHYLKRRFQFNVRFWDILPPFVKEVGYVSHNFFESSLSAIQLFFNTVTISGSPEILPLISSIASHFGAKIQSLSLVLYDSAIQKKDVPEFPNMVTSLETENSSLVQHLLDSTSSFYLSRLNCLDISIESNNDSDWEEGTFGVIGDDDVTNKTHTDAFNSFCKSLMNNTTITELKIYINCLKSCDFNSFAEVFGSNKTLKALCLCFKVSPKDEESLLLYNSIAINSCIEKIDLFQVRIQNPTVLAPLFNSSSLKSITFPRYCSLTSSEFKGLLNNSSLEELVLDGNSFNPEDLAYVLKFNTSLKKVEIFEDSFRFRQYAKLLNQIVIY
ncbi:hypothetical protein GEMRC1_008289 [Eukaryota sp. GEM-RC1]